MTTFTTTLTFTTLTLTLNHHQTPLSSPYITTFITLHYPTPPTYITTLTLITLTTLHHPTPPHTTTGKEWDSEMKEWIVYDLKHEADTILEMTFEEYLVSLTAGGAAGVLMEY